MKEPSPFSPEALPRDFAVWGLRCGISSVAGKKDLALFYSRRRAAAAGVFTRNRVKAAPVLMDQKSLAVHPWARAVLINSGCANACTGPRGMEDALWSREELAGALNLPAREVLVASTGVIGRPLPRAALGAGIQSLARAARRSPPSVNDALRAIMTTDTRPKAAVARFSFGGKTFALWGCAKGAGMIHPDMATMLSVLLTDAGLPSAILRRELRSAADASFNRLSVDGDTSTNDSVFLLANGAVKSYKALPAGLASPFRAALRQICLSLSAQIAADGEGATRTAWIFVQGAKKEAEAAQAARTIATSPLVKTALHGADPNWGRVLAALGRSGVDFDLDRVEVRFGDTAVFQNGAPAPWDAKVLHALLKKPKVTISVDLRQGRAWSHYVTCDFSKDYVAVNADYTT